MFFVSWQLWEKMTFVLGVAIVAVFCIGYVKLLWRNRLVGKQEIIDEEKRTRIQELRRSGQIIESSKNHDIPFGIRAIQSGIQVDGIWISNTNTPLPSSLRVDNIPPGSDSGMGAHASTDMPYQVGTSGSRQGPSSPRGSDLVNVPLDDLMALDRLEASGNRTSYKPRKSSHLRYGSHGDTQFDEETLVQLEGKASPKKKIYAHRPRGFRQLDVEADSSAADNEQSSGSSDSEVTLSGHRQLEADRQGPYSVTRDTIQGEKAPMLAATPSGRPSREQFRKYTSRTDYFGVPSNSFDRPLLDPFTTPSTPPEPGLFGTVHALDIATATSGGYQPLEQSRGETPPPFVPGELHVNKSVRKVNSGFEVLPAGTFGVPAEAKGNEMDFDSRYEDEPAERRHTKLQKKHRTSMTGRRISGAMDRT